MAVLPQAVDYTDKDFDSLRLRLQSLIKSVFPDWTDFSVANFGNLLVELYAFVGDVLTFYQDNQARESRILTATQRKNLLGLVKLIGYIPSGASAATVNETFSLSAVAPANVTIPAGTKVKTASVTDPVEFQLLAPVVIPASSLSATSAVENSQSQSEGFSSTGLPNQELSLASTPFLDGSAIISADNGPYTEVDSFLQATATDRNFTVTVDDNDRATVRFGNGINGAIPVGTITVAYKTGGGATGNVSANSITQIEGNFTDALGNPVTLSVNNPTAATGGTDRESAEQIRALAPASIRVIGRTVAREDFEINAKLVPGVDRALLLTKNEDSAIAENTGALYIVPAGAGFPSSALKAAVLTQVTVTYPSPLTFVVQVLDPIYLDIGVYAKVFLKPGASSATVRSSIVAALQSYFALKLANGADSSLVDFGFNLKAASGTPSGKVPLSDLFDAVRDVDGVREIGDALADFQLSATRVVASESTPVQTLSHQDVPIEIRAFPRLASVGALPDVTLINGDTGAAL